MSTIEDITSRMTALVEGAADRDLTDDEAEQYEAMEKELAVARRSEEIRARNTAMNSVRPFIPAQRAAAVLDSVKQSLPYNLAYRKDASGTTRPVFDYGSDGHDFSTDLHALVNSNGADYKAAERINALIAAQFKPRNDVDQADVNELSPNVNRPDLWQPQMDYSTPLWDMIASGTTDGRPFDVPKFNSSSGLVGPATEGTEPAPGAFTLTGQTITPTQVWGKVEITRQAARRVGNPALSGILWEQMLREYYEDREAAVATFLNTLTAAADITITAGATDNDAKQARTAQLEAALVGLQFVRGGNRFRAFAVQEDLYKMIASTEDDAGRPKYPILNPMNANGTTANLYSTMNVGGTTAVPAWALGAGGATTAQNSWLFDPAKVRGWASAPERLDWNFGATVQTANIPQLSHVTVGIYGDIALANLDINGVRQVIWDPVA
jgi:hypothetical protein